MAKLYRVEDADGWGMYTRYNSVSDEMQPSRGDDAAMRHPNPRDDSALCKAVAERGNPIAWGAFNYGFTSIDQFKHWVHKQSWRQSLQIEGFVLNVYECADEDFFAGDTQAVVLLDKPRTLIETLQLTEV